MLMILVVLMALMFGDDATDSDVCVKMWVEAPLTGTHASIWQCVCTPLYFCQIILKVP